MADILCELTVYQDNYSASVTTLGGETVAQVTVAQETMESTVVVGQVGAKGDPGDKGDSGDKGDPGDQLVFVQETRPNFNGLTGIWLQTGMENNGFTIWFEDGE